MDLNQISQGIAELQNKLEQLNAQYEMANKGAYSHSFNERREIRGKMRLFNMQIDLLKQEAKKLYL